jgi:hypothetical protein
MSIRVGGVGGLGCGGGWWVLGVGGHSFGKVVGVWVVSLRWSVGVGVWCGPWSLVRRVGKFRGWLCLIGCEGLRTVAGVYLVGCEGLRIQQPPTGSAGPVESPYPRP